jgi:DMSO/TMAO reductase YedYZ molybdopterin-dependent catalytic subunit
LRLLRLLAAVAVLALPAFASASAVASTSVPNQQSSIGLPAGKFLVIGDVARPHILDMADLQAMPSRTVAVTFRSDKGVEHHVYVGPRLFDVLAQAGPQFDPAIKNDKLRYFVSVSGSDGYRALVAYGEIDPSFEGKDVLLATSEDGRSLATEGPQLVVPGDSSGGRYVTNVVRVFLEKPARRVLAKCKASPQ